MMSCFKKTWWLYLLVIFSTAIISVHAMLLITRKYIGEWNGWGSIIGGFISGSITLIGVIVTILTAKKQFVDEVNNKDKAEDRRIRAQILPCLAITNFSKLDDESRTQYFSQVEGLNSIAPNGVFLLEDNRAIYRNRLPNNYNIDYLLRLPCSQRPVYLEYIKLKIKNSGLASAINCDIRVYSIICSEDIGAQHTGRFIMDIGESADLVLVIKGELSNPYLIYLSYYDLVQGTKYVQKYKFDRGELGGYYINHDGYLIKIEKERVLFNE